MPILDYSTDESNDRFWGLTLTTWVQIITVAALMCALFRFNLVRLWGKTNPFNGQDPNWQHSIFVPLIGIYYLYIHRDELMRAAGKPAKRELSIRILAILGLLLVGSVTGMLFATGSIDSSLLLCALLTLGMAISAVVPLASVFGTALMLSGLLIFAFGIYPGQNDYFKDLGMVITLFGVATLLAGWPVMKVAWFPIVFLVVALPWPELVYAKLAWPLQQLAASAAVGTLRIFNVDAQNFGTKILMRGEHGDPRMLNVAEACAGLKSVMTFLMVAGTVAFLGSKPLWEKIVITLSAIPIAIFCNTMRVSGQGLLDYYWSHDASVGFAHQFVGLMMLIPGFFLILVVSWVLEKIFIEEVDREKLAKAGAARSKRIVVEVPKRPEPAVEGEAKPVVEVSDVEPEVPPLVAKAPVPALVAKAPAIAPVAAKVPAVAPIVVKAKTEVVAAAPARIVSPPASTLKPSSKPSVRNPAVTPPPSGLKPSTLKPSAPKAVAPVPPSTLKPSTLKPSSPKPPGGLKPPMRKPPSAGAEPV